MENKKKKTNQNIFQMSLGNEQNPLQLILNGHDKNIQICFNSKDSKKNKAVSLDRKHAWIPPPGKTTKKAENCSLYQSPANEIMLTIPEDGKFVLPSGTPFTIESHHLENFKAAFYPPLVDTVPPSVTDTASDTVVDYTKRIKENYEKQYSVLKESEKLLKEHETKKSILTKYVQILKRNMEEISNSFKEIEKHEDEELDEKSPRKMPLTRRKSDKYYRKHEKMDQSFMASKSDKSDTQKDTEFYLSDNSGKGDLKCGVETQRRSYVQPATVNIPEGKHFQKEIIQVEEKRKKGKMNNGVFQTQNGTSAENAMMKLADNIRKSKLLLDSAFVQEGNINALQKKYIQGAEALYECNHRLLKDICEALETSQFSCTSSEDMICNSPQCSGNIISSNGCPGNASPSNDHPANDCPENGSPDNGSLGSGSPENGSPSNSTEKFDDFNSIDDKYLDFKGEITGKFKLNSMPNIPSYLQNQSLEEKLAIANFQLKKLKKELHQAKTRESKMSKLSNLCTGYDAKQRKSVNKDLDGNGISLNAGTFEKRDSNIKEVIGSIIHKYNTLRNKQCEENDSEAKIIQKVKKNLPPVSVDKKKTFVRFSDEESLASLSDIQKTLQELGKTFEKLIPKEIKREDEQVEISVKSARQTGKDEAHSEESGRDRQAHPYSEAQAAAETVASAPLPPPAVAISGAQSPSSLSEASAAIVPSPLLPLATSPLHSPPLAASAAEAPVITVAPPPSIERTVTERVQSHLPLLKTAPLSETASTVPPVATTTAAAPPIASLLPSLPPPTPLEAAEQHPEIDRHYLRDERLQSTDDRNLVKLTHKGSSGFEVQDGTPKFYDTHPLGEKQYHLAQSARMDEVPGGKNDYVVTPLETGSVQRGGISRKDAKRTFREWLDSSIVPDFKGVKESTRVQGKYVMPEVPYTGEASRRGLVLPEEQRIHYRRRRSTVGQSDIPEEIIFPNKMIDSQTPSNAREQQFNIRQDLTENIGYDQLESGSLYDNSPNAEDGDEMNIRQSPDNQWFVPHRNSYSRINDKFRQAFIYADQAHADDLLSGNISELLSVSQRSNSGQNPHQWNLLDETEHQNSSTNDHENQRINMTQVPQHFDSMMPENISQLHSESQQQQSNSHQGPSHRYKLDGMSSFAADDDLNQGKNYEDNARLMSENISQLPFIPPQVSSKEDTIVNTNVMNSDQTYPKQPFMSRITPENYGVHERPLNRIDEIHPRRSPKSKSISVSYKEQFFPIQKQDTGITSRGLVASSRPQVKVENTIQNQHYRKRLTYPYYSLTSNQSLNRKPRQMSSKESPRSQDNRRRYNLSPVPSRSPQPNQQPGSRRHTFPSSLRIKQELKIRKLYEEIMS